MSAALKYAPSPQSSIHTQPQSLPTPANDNVPLGYNCHLHLLMTEVYGNAVTYLHTECHCRGLLQLDLIHRIKSLGYAQPFAKHPGSLAAGTNASGTSLWIEHSTPFGETLINNSANDDLCGYTGHIKDKATGLNYMHPKGISSQASPLRAQAHYQDPIIGRFLSVDPVGFSLGRTGMFNRYSYTLNNPINLIDPDGKDPFDQFDTIDNAATDLLVYAGRLSALEDGRVKLERGGDILQNKKTGKFYYDSVEKGTYDRIDYNISRSKTVATAHSHPPKKGGKGLEDARNNRSNNGKLSRQDKKMIKQINKVTGKKLPHYLGSSNGSVTKFTYKENKYRTGTRIRRIKTIKFKVEKKKDE